MADIGRYLTRVCERPIVSVIALQRLATAMRLRPNARPRGGRSYARISHSDAGPFLFITIMLVS